MHSIEFESKGSNAILKCSDNNPLIKVWRKRSQTPRLQPEIFLE